MISGRLVEDILSFSEGILINRRGLLWIAIRQRAKFEHWFKFELTARLEHHESYSDVTVEETCRGGRADIAFSFGGSRYFLWLKTPNSNWRFPDVGVVGRPVTKNYAGMLIDIHNMKKEDDHGMLLAALFPVDSTWSQYELREKISASYKGSEVLTHDHQIRIVNMRESIGVALLLFS